jgi:hypothetical protein
MDRRMSVMDNFVSKRHCFDEINVCLSRPLGRGYRYEAVSEAKKALERAQSRFTLEFKDEVLLSALEQTKLIVCQYWN